MTSSHESRVGAPGPRPRSVRLASGEVLDAPDGWDLLEPGDAGLTRRVKAAGPTWLVQEKRGRRTFSRGLWAPADTIERCRAEVEAQRATPAYQARLAKDRARRQREHEEYAAEFEAGVRDFLAFHPRFDDLGRRVAGAIARHATPVGSGTVARTRRIPMERRVEAAVIAWLRHQTTAYDRMQIRRVKGRRREVRRALAEQSRRLLEGYRRGDAPPRPCPLERALDDGEGPEPQRTAAAVPEPPRPAAPPAGDRDEQQRALQERIRRRLAGGDG